jgi:hypothetical protein
VVFERTYWFSTSQVWETLLNVKNQIIFTVSIEINIISVRPVRITDLVSSDVFLHLFYVVVLVFFSESAVDVIVHSVQNIWRRNMSITLSNAKLFIDTKIICELSV